MIFFLPVKMKFLSLILHGPPYRPIDPMLTEFQGDLAM